MKLFPILFLLSLAFGCATSMDGVRPGADGIHRVIVRGEDGELTETEALAQATKYCRSKNGVVEIIKQKPQTIAQKKAKTRAASFKEVESAVSDLEFKCK